MNASPETFADVEQLVAVIATSPIHVTRLALPALLADWANTRKSANVDDVVLAWIASHVSAAGRRKSAH
ncbi:MAG: hypothetical protein QOI12_511 [Alphaproteobacteria bacterium]|jgi:hypothetical protein|nr:hypothetical protein [Alphaproteobacteria bacterium]